MFRDSGPGHLHHFSLYCIISAHCCPICGPVDLIDNHPTSFCLQIGDELWDENEEVVRRLPADPFFDGKDPQHIAQLCAETIDDGHSVLMFCGTKKVRRHLERPDAHSP